MDLLARTPVELVVPGDSRSLRLARLVASGVAAWCGLPFNELEDFCLAVDEICVVLIEAGDGEPIYLTFATDSGTLVTCGRTRDASRTDLNEARLALSHRVLGTIADSHRLSQVDGQTEITMVTRLRGVGVG